VLVGALFLQYAAILTVARDAQIILEKIKIF
jgi:hypothetical protein